MTRLRRFSVLLTFAVLLAGSSAPAHAQSAGDDQYADPFAGSPAPKPTPSTSAAPAPAPAAPPSTPAPAAAAGSNDATAPSGGSDPAGTSAPAIASGPAPAAGPAPAGVAELAETGADVWRVAGLGLVLLLAGLGLRLRTADGPR